MSEIIVTKTFEEKMKDRIKGSIGDLVSDEDLSKLVHKGIEEVFFSKTKIVVNSYRTDEGPSLIEGIVKDLLEDKVRLEVASWINSNPEEVKDIVSKIVSDGVGMSVVKAFSMSFQNQLFNFQNEINNKLANQQF